MDPNFEGEKARNNCFGFDKINLEKPRSRRQTKIASSKIRAFGLLLVPYLAIENRGSKNLASSLQQFQRWPTYGTKEQVILQRLHAKDLGTPSHPTRERDILEREITERDILKRDIFGRDTPLERDILKGDILKSIIEERDS